MCLDQRDDSVVFREKKSCEYFYVIFNLFMSCELAGFPPQGFTHNKTAYFRFMASTLLPAGSLKVQLQSSVVGHHEAPLGQLAAAGEVNVSH